ncbi:YgcG family protein [Acetivibrio sp. MSJd-27]|uniref:TPM domain-containing protein n=1 Tax=Acetivibrio sp. MSJd-27 TaxID=2841523 RepID=UPI001C10C571|nr:TPM domain-containing protein [Acetivibrio sp. MSJd-27]MBU5450903.1 TPM domain-containing protein [Acetivibrio sp. MSJd-27]
MKRLFCIYMISLFFLCQALAADIPGPSRAFYVNDWAEVLHYDVESELVRILLELDQREMGQIVAVTVSSLEGEAIEEYAKRMFEAYQIGGEWQKGALILMVKDEKRAYIKVGAGLSDALTPEFCSSVIAEHTVSNLKKNRYMPALDEMIFALRKEIDPAGTVVRPEKKFLEMAHPESVFFLIVLVAGLIVSTILFLRRKDKKNEKVPDTLNELYYGDWRFRELNKLRERNPKKRS